MLITQHPKMKKARPSQNVRGGPSVPGRRFELLKAYAGGFTVRFLWPLGQPGMHRKCVDYFTSTYPQERKSRGQSRYPALSDAFDGVDGDLAQCLVCGAVRKEVEFAFDDVEVLLHCVE